MNILSFTTVRTLADTVKDWLTHSRSLRIIRKMNERMILLVEIDRHP